jgi:hypothetical protein
MMKWTWPRLTRRLTKVAPHNCLKKETKGSMQEAKIKHKPTYVEMTFDAANTRWFATLTEPEWRGRSTP